MKVKNSFYNEIISIKETNEFLLYNILTGGLSVLDNEVGSLLQTLEKLDEFDISEYADHASVLRELYDQGFMVDSYIDEAAQFRDEYALEQSIKYRNSADIGLTIGTTIICNMGCPYCFETVKPNKTLKDEKVLNGIVRYIEDMINNASVKKWSSLTIAWYGGEPLINKDAIKYLSKEFIAISEKYDIPYNATIISNGLLLDAETWMLLKENKVTSIQVTIDGSKEVHDQYRPLKAAQGRNYERILENLTLLPEGIQLAIRVNTDKRVAATLEKLLDDLSDYGLWPQRHGSVSVNLAWLRPYEGADNSKMINLTQNEFFDTNNNFSRLKLKRYNQWADLNCKERGKLKWHTPTKQSDCSTYVSPYFFTFDPEGGIHKCWETVHDKKKGSGVDVFRRWSPEDFDRYLNYSRTKIHPVCASCKFNPVCEGLTCAYDTIKDLREEHFPCTSWKSKLKEYFKQMYLEMKEFPEVVVLQSEKAKKSQTHANK